MWQDSFCLICVIYDSCLNCWQAFRAADESSADAAVAKDTPKAAASISKDVKKVTEKTKKLDVKSDVMFSFVPLSFLFWIIVERIFSLLLFQRFWWSCSYFHKMVIKIKGFWFLFWKFSIMFDFFLISFNAFKLIPFSITRLSFEL